MPHTAPRILMYGSRTGDTRLGLSVLGPRLGVARSGPVWSIHPGARIGRGFFRPRAGVVIGETAQVGDHCVLFHNVTLGGTGKYDGQRHPWWAISVHRVPTRSCSAPFVSVIREDRRQCLRDQSRRAGARHRGGHAGAGRQAARRARRRGAAADVPARRCGRGRSDRVNQPK